MRRLRRAWGILAWIGAAAVSARTSAEDLTELSLEQLMAVEVVTATRSEQPLLETPAAVDVVTGEQIRRAGVTRLPEALRLAPGVQSRPIDASKMAITMRGFNNRFANKLLVLIDGRTIYSPLFAGVWWEAQDLVLDDVDRIEAVRGPGGALWGANAMNGVINILTLPASQTQGASVTAAAGPEERGTVAVRYGGRMAPGVWYRVSGKTIRRDALTVKGERTADNWHLSRAAARIDGERGTDAWSLDGELFGGRFHQTMEDGLSWSPPYAVSYDFSTEVRGGHLLGHWTRRWEDGEDLRLSAVYDGYRRRDMVAPGRWHTLGLDLQRGLVLGSGDRLTAGVEIRGTWDELESSERFSFSPASRRTQVVSGFLHHEMALADRGPKLVLGAKLEHNSFTGTEVLPSLRCLWNDRQRRWAVWGAVSRAVRLPTRAEVEGEHLADLQPLSGNPADLLVVRFRGNAGLRAEELVAYETGVRARLSPRVNLEATGFYNVYDDLLSGEPATTWLDTTASPRQLVVVYTGGNMISGRTWGGEVTGEVRPVSGWRVRGGYAYLRMDLHTDPGSQDPGMLEYLGDNPHHRALLQSSIDLSRRVELDAVLEYTGRLPYGWQDRHVTLDLRLGWQLGPGLELAAIGRNLIGSGLSGLDPELFDTLATESQRVLLAELSWRWPGR